MRVEPAKYPITIQCEALPTSTRVIGLRGSEAVSRPYGFDAFLAVPVHTWNADLDAALGRSAVVQGKAREEGEAPMLFSGIIARLELVREHDEEALVEARIVPRLWRLGLSAHSRVFTGMSVRDVIAEVLNDNGLGGTYELQLLESYESRDQICQYRESDLAFISRWMEREGIYYYFRHERDGEHLVISDQGVYSPAPLDAPVRYFPQRADSRLRVPSLRRFSCRARSLAGEVRVSDYDHQQPDAALVGRAPIEAGGHAVLSLHGENFQAADAGRRVARLRAEEQATQHAVYSASGTCIHLRPASTFQLDMHPREELNGRYLVVDAYHEWAHPEARGEFAELLGFEHDDPYWVELRAVPSRVQLRPERLTPWPRIYGHELAVIDGPADSEYAQLDADGRYLARFLFDEAEGSPGSRSAYLRMMQPHGGTVEGFHFPLRKGTEVVVTFLGGDPDRPVIAGVVPNARRRSPVTQSNATLNVIQTGGRNRIELEDRKGDERVDISSPTKKTHVHLGAHHGEHEHNVIVSTEGNSRLHTGASCDVFVGGDRHDEVAGDLEETYRGDQTIVVEGALKESVRRGSDQTITGNAARTVNGDVTEQINGSTAQTITGKLEQTVTGGVSVTTPAKVTINATGGFELVAPGGSKIIAPAGHTVIAPGGQVGIDSWYSGIGGTLKHLFGVKEDEAVISRKTAAIMVTYAALKLDTIATKTELGKVVIKKAELALTQSATEIRRGAAVLCFSGNIIIQ